MQSNAEINSNSAYHPAFGMAHYHALHAQVGVIAIALARPRNMVSTETGKEDSAMYARILIL